MMSLFLIIKIAVLFLVCLLAVITDIKYRKVFNWLTFPAMSFGLIINTIEQGMPGLGLAMIGLLTGGLLFFPAFFFGGMGAGDIKLMAVVGAFMGWAFAINTALYTALAGGLIAMVYLLIKGLLIQSFFNIFRFFRSLIIPKLAVEPLSQEHPFPYAVAIAVGAACAVWLPPLMVF